MGRFTDGQSLPAMPANGMPGVTSQLDGDADDNYGAGATVQTQQWGDDSPFPKADAREIEVHSEDMI